MAIYLSDDDVRKVLTMPACVDVLDDLFKQDAQGLVENLPRQRIRLPKSTMTLMGGYALGSGAFLVRHSTANLLYSTDSGRLEAVLSPRDLAWIRTGAATGLATKYMAREDASVVGIIGTGRQAITQLEGICAVRPVKLVKAFSRAAENRERFSAEMRELLGVDVQPADSPEAAVRGSDIVVTITNAREPVFDGAWLDAGTHVNAAGANSPNRHEVDDVTIQRAAVVAVDNLDQAKLECGELIVSVERGLFRWRQAVELADIVGGKVSGRPSADAITLFESQGLGIEDTAAAAYVFEQAKAQGLGTPLPF